MCHVARAVSYQSPSAWARMSIASFLGSTRNVIPVVRVRSCIFFFFSSRRRHTRSLCDWSSDVCSSDLYDLASRIPYLPYAMSWFNELLGGPAEKPTAHGPRRPAAPGPVPAPTVDPDAVRAALATVTDEEVRQRHIEELGCALAAMCRKPSLDDAPGVWAAALRHVADRSLALQWLASLNGDRWLGEVAVLGRLAEFRLAALPR